jgi:hypothetical protein
MRVAPEIVAGMCRVRSRDLLRPFPGALSGVDPVKLLWGIAGVESSFGRDSYPRHEAGYCFGGRYFDHVGTAEWGCLAHCSYGPWQVMYANFPKGISPIGLLVQADGHVAADASLQAAIGVLNWAIARGASSLTDLVIAYNGPEHEESYVARLLANLDRPMPQFRDSVLT